MQETEKKVQYMTCQKCEGKLKEKKCSRCFNFGVIGWDGEYLLYWGKKINPLQVALRDAKKIIKKATIIIFSLFGIFGVLMLAWAAYLFFNSNLSFSDLYKIKNWQLLIFWISMLSNCYIYYLQKNSGEEKLIPSKKYREEKLIFNLITEDEIDGLSAKKKINISKYLSETANQAFFDSWKTANRYGSKEIAPVHLFLSLLGTEEIQIVFSRLGINFEDLKNRIIKLLYSYNLQEKPPSIEINKKVKKILFDSYFLAYSLRQKKIGTTEILESLVKNDDSIQEILYDLNITSDKIENVAAWLRIKGQLRENWRKFRKKASLKPGGAMNRAMTAIATPALDKFGRDLTLLAKYGYLMPCIGRQKEINEIFSIMSGGTRRSAVLVGNSGVGKKTIIEGIAQMMVEENVPKFLKDKRLVSLNIAQLVSGVDASQAQERMIIILNEVRRSGNIILVINDIHGIIGISAGWQGGSVDLADVLSQALGNGSILSISTTTPTEYRQYIENKNSLSSVLEKINIEEISGNEAIQILESKIGAIEYHNKIYFSYDAIAKTVELSNRYLHDRFLPEKAIEILQQTANVMSGKKGINSIITANDVAAVISEKTNIPLTEITQEESEKLVNLEVKIHERVVGQDEAVEMVASSLRRARAEMRDQKKPIVNLLFLGPTGVGKTELAKTIAEVYFGDENKMIRLDMSEYQEKSSINRLIGSPPGYSQTKEGGYFAEAVRKNPFSLILLDEIEKAHPEILNIFLQILDDGRLTDSSGRTIDFTNAIIIATSNAGSDFIKSMVKKQTPILEIQKQLMDDHLDKYFRPEFLNRFDGIIVFKPLTIKDVESITKLILVKIKQNLEINKGIILKATPEAITELANAGFSLEFGARPLIRVIQKSVQDPITNYILSNQINRRDTIIIKSGGQIEINKAKEI